MKKKKKKKETRKISTYNKYKKQFHNINKNFRIRSLHYDNKNLLKFNIKPFQSRY